MLTFPVLRALEGHVGAVTAWSKAKLAAAVVEGVMPIHGDTPAWTGLFAPEFEPEAVVAEMLASAERIISFVSDGRDAWASNVKRLAPQARMAFVPPRPPASWSRHVCDWHRTQLVEQGIDIPDVAVPVRDNPRGPIIVHPGSGGLDKCWPMERFEALTEKLTAAGHNVRMIGGEVERNYRVEHLQTLEELLVVLRDAGQYIGNDSGPTHLAAQLGVPTLALFGPTDPRVWGPRGPAVRILAPPAPCPMTWLTADTVAAQFLAYSM